MQQERRIRNLAKELKAARKDICKLKAGNVSSNFMEQDNSGNWGGEQKIPTPGPVGSLLSSSEQQIQYTGNRCIGSWSANPSSVEA
jgi:hypothetical protein